MLRDENKNGKMDRNELFTFTKDHLGSIREVMDQKQDVIQRYSYSSYGKTKLEKIAKDRSTVVDVPYGYTSREWEKETGDYFYRARYYDPETGRFLSEDPIGFSGGDFNLYRYVLGNPVGAVDPSGKLTLPEVCIGVIAVGMIGYRIYKTTQGGPASRAGAAGGAADRIQEEWHSDLNEEKGDDKTNACLNDKNNKCSNLENTYDDGTDTTNQFDSPYTMGAF